MADVQWFYARNDQQLGPVMAAELKQLAAAGELGRDDLVWREGMDQWTPASRIKGLFPDGSPAEPSAPEAGQALPPGEPEPDVAPVAAPAPERVFRRPQAPATIEPRSNEGILLLIQALLWGTCVAVVLVGGVLFLVAIFRADGDNNKVAAAGATYMTFFIAAYIIARAGEKICRLLRGDSGREGHP